MRKTLPLLGLAVLLFLSISGCGSSSKDAASTTTAENVVTRLTYSVTIPEAWEIDNSQAKATHPPDLLLQDSQNSGTILVGLSTLSGDSPDERMNRLIDSQDTKEQKKLAKSIQKSNLDGTPTVAVVGNASPDTTQMVVLFSHGNNDYVVTYLSPPESFDKNLKAMRAFMQSWKWNE